MKKKTLALMLATAMALNLGACGKEETHKETSTQESATEETESEDEVLEIVDTASSDYVKYFDENGKLKDIKQSDLEKLTGAGDLSKIKVYTDTFRVNDEMLQDAKETMVWQYSSLDTDTNTTIKADDVIEISYDGSVDNKDYAELSSGGYPVVVYLDKDSMDSADREAFVGKHPGDTFEITKKLPENDESNELSGKEAVIKITVTGVYDMPEFNDQFIAEHTDQKTVEAWENWYKDFQEEINIKNTLYWNMLLECENIDTTTFLLKEYPEGLVEAYSNMVITGSYKYYNDQMANVDKTSGTESATDGESAEASDEAEVKTLTFEEMVKNQYGSIRDYKTAIESDAQYFVTRMVLMNKAANDLGLDLSTEEFKEYVESWKSSNGITEEQYKYYDELSYIESAFEEYVMDKLVENADIIEGSGAETPVASEVETSTETSTEVETTSEVETESLTEAE